MDNKINPWLLSFLILVLALALPGAIAPWQAFVALAVAALVYFVFRSRSK